MAPAREGLAGATAVRVLAMLRYHGFKESSWETVKENLDEAEAAEAASLGEGSKRREVVRGWAVKMDSSAVDSKSWEETTAVNGHKSTKGRAPCVLKNLPS